MDKQEIKAKLLKAIKNDNHFDDIKSVAICGSYVNNMPTQDSDINVLIDFESDAVIGFFALSDIKDNFESFLKRQVDLLTPQAISKYFREDILWRRMKDMRNFLIHEYFGVNTKVVWDTCKNDLLDLKGFISDILSQK